MSFFPDNVMKDLMEARTTNREEVPLEQQIALNEIVRVCEKVVITFPTPLHESFHGDPSHHEVKLDFKTGRCIYIKEG